MKITTKAGLKVRATVKAGGVGTGNHSRPGLKVRLNVRAGEILLGNHCRRGLTAA
jgi:hypothetical protein